MSIEPDGHGSPAPKTWRLLDTGFRSAAENIALDSALLGLREAGKVPNTLRILGFSSPCVLVGFHQSVGQEIRLDYCRGKGIEINRRLTGGGAVYIDQKQIGWELIVSREGSLKGKSLAGISKIVCGAAVESLKLLGVEAKFRPRNDIEAGGRKIAGTGGVYEDNSMLFQGTLLIDFDAESMIKALRIPTEKLTRHGIESAAERVTSLRQLTGEVHSYSEIKNAFKEGFAGAFGVEIIDGPLTGAEASLSNQSLPRISSEKWIYKFSEPEINHRILKSIHKGRGGIVRSAVSLDVAKNRIKSVNITGDFFMRPRRALLDLESHLKNARVDDLEGQVTAFFDRSSAECLDLDSNDFYLSLRKAVEKVKYEKLGIAPVDINKISLIGSLDLKKALAGASALLLPYCAKLPDCRFRNMDGCDECGDCSVGEAYGLAREKGIRPVTVTGYEHLQETFDRLRGKGVKSFIGCCCRAFQVKRYSAFYNSGMTSVLLDIENTTCYELGNEEEAYAGNFKNQTDLSTTLLKRVFELVQDQKNMNEPDYSCPGCMETG